MIRTRAFLFITLMSDALVVIVGILVAIAPFTSGALVLGSVFVVAEVSLVLLSFRQGVRFDGEVLALVRPWRVNYLPWAEVTELRMARSMLIWQIGKVVTRDGKWHRLPGILEFSWRRREPSSGFRQIQEAWRVAASN